MFLFNFISGLDNYPNPLVFRPQHTHNYKSLCDARQSLRQMSKQPINLRCRPSLEFPPPKNGMGWKGGGQIISGRLCAISFTIHHCNNNKKIIIIV